jgi:hypothetical protein
MAESKKSSQVAGIDGLYGLPLAEFTPARNALVKALRAAGEREAADEAAAARKPTVGAWAVNQLLRDEPRAIEQLLALGRELREAQAALIAGGDADPVVSLSERERRLVQELVQKASRILTQSGGRASEAALDEVAETLHAAALDEESAEAVASGRLTRERRAIGLGLGAAGPAPRRAAARRERPGPPARVTNAEQRLAEARTEAREARKAAEEAERELRRAERQASHAARAAEQAAERERRAAEALERARGRA